MMLDFFIVLGQVPGTNIQLTFSEILIALEILSVGWFLWRRFSIRARLAEKIKSLRTGPTGSYQIIRPGQLLSHRR